MNETPDGADRMRGAKPFFNVLILLAVVLTIAGVVFFLLLPAAPRHPSQVYCFTAPGAPPDALETCLTSSPE